MSMERLKIYRKEIVGLAALSLATFITVVSNDRSDISQESVTVVPLGTVCDTIPIKSELSEKKADVIICKTPGWLPFVRGGQQNILPGSPEPGDACKVQRVDSFLMSDPEVVGLGVCERKGEERLIIGILKRVKR